MKAHRVVSSAEIKKHPHQSIAAKDYMKREAEQMPALEEQITNLTLKQLYWKRISAKLVKQLKASERARTAAENRVQDAEEEVREQKDKIAHL